MPLRYALAVLIAYGAFLLLVRVWIAYQSGSILNPLDAVNLPGMPGDADGSPLPGESLAGGGGFGGGGAGRMWDASGSLSASRDASSLDGGDAVHAVLPDLDEALLPVITAAVLVGGLLAAFYLIYSAPVFFAEVLLDVLLVSGLYRRLRRSPPGAWLATAVRRTWGLVLWTLVLLAFAGFVMQRIVPDADSIGDVIRVMGEGRQGHEGASAREYRREWKNARRRRVDATPVRGRESRDHAGPCGLLPGGCPSGHRGIRW